ncbi:MAG TPA: PhnD/SsuA/transferrin family substrate-binding protein [Myxococcaceae bacterium]|nr:PhnD/SsuA/transferrin family substrate-binding protein [Myxococcaceae bacterium]
MLTLLLPPSRGHQDAQFHARHVSRFLGERLEREVEVEVAPDYATLEHRLLRGEVELAWAPPILCARAEPTARGILSSIRVGRSSYRSALVARADRHLSLKTLAGREAVWTDPLSTGGYLLPTAFLSLLGQAGALGGERFMGTYRSALEEVLEGRADLTGIYTPRADANAVRVQLQELVGERAKELEALGFTDEVPADGLVIGQKVPAEEAPGLLQSLLSLGTVGRNPLMEALAAERLVPARSGDYRPLRHAARPR